MSINYHGHSALDIERTQRCIDYMRDARPDWFSGPLELGCARPLGRFGAEIARDFGIKAQCLFTLHVRDKGQIAVVHPALDYIYQVFGTEFVVMSWEMDQPRPPVQASPGLKLD